MDFVIDKKMQEKYSLQYGESNPILRTKCKEVKHINPEIQELIDVLPHMMHYYEGVGLAAPQIGSTWRIVAITQWDTSFDSWVLQDEIVMINPLVIAKSESVLKDKEACLSLPGVQGVVERPQFITVQYHDTSLKKKIYKAQGYNARIILHEIDHLDGILFIDKMAKKV